MAFLVSSEVDPVKSPHVRDRYLLYKIGHGCLDAPDLVVGQCVHGIDDERFDTQTWMLQAVVEDGNEKSLGLT